MPFKIPATNIVFNGLLQQWILWYCHGQSVTDSHEMDHLYQYIRFSLIFPGKQRWELLGKVVIKMVTESV